MEGQKRLSGLFSANLPAMFHYLSQEVIFSIQIRAIFTILLYCTFFFRVFNFLQILTAFGKFCGAIKLFQWFCLISDIVVNDFEMSFFKKKTIE